MKWTTEKVNQVSDRLRSGENMKSIIRDISIDTIINNEDKNPKFPFYIPKSGPVDPSLKSSYIPFDYTIDEIKSMMIYQNNPVDLYKYIKGLNVLECEEEIINESINNRFLIFNAPRKVGISTLLSFICSHYLIKHESKTILFLTESSKFMMMYQKIPYYLKPGICHMNKSNQLTEVKFDNGCKILVSQHKYMQHPIGRSFDYVVIDDLLVTPNFDQIIYSISAIRDSQILIYNGIENISFNGSQIFQMFKKINTFREYNLEKIFCK